jgi:hypothetical protein
VHVPVFLTRQVLVKIVPPTTSLLSGIVTSCTNEALFVQSGEFVGPDGLGVEVSAGCVADVVSEVGALGVSVTVGATVVVGDAVALWVSVEIGTAVSVEAPPPQAESITAMRVATMNSFLVILNLLCSSSLIKLMD